MAKAAQNRTDDDVERMTTHLAAMERTTDTGTWTIGNAQFHAMLADAARAPQTAAVLDRLRNRSALYVATYLRDRPNLITEANQEHREQLRACVDQDVGQIRTITKRHLTGTLRWARRALKDSDGPAVTTSLR
jgi:DNA-binding GntR family transcriptional regulator